MRVIWFLIANPTPSTGGCVMRVVTLASPVAALTHTQRHCPVCVGDAEHSQFCSAWRGPLQIHRPMTVEWLTFPPGEEPATGERIVIRADDPKPPVVGEFGEWSVVYRLHDGVSVLRRGYPVKFETVLHPGCIVASATIGETLPIGHRHPPLGAEPLGLPCILNDEGRALERWQRGTPPCADISDQLPFADWSPGRVAVRLVDVAATTDRCPHCWGSSFEPSEAICHAHDLTRCRICGHRYDVREAGRCDPIPWDGRRKEWP